MNSKRSKSMLHADLTRRYNLKDGIEKYNSIIEEYPHYLLAYAALYRRYITRKEDQLAEQLYERMLKLTFVPFSLTAPLPQVLVDLESHEMNPDTYYSMAEWFRKEKKVE